MNMNFLDKPYIVLKDTADDRKVNLREWIHKYLYMWPWILLSIILCLIIAFLYIKYTPLQYQVTAKVYIKDQTDKPESQVALKELQLFSDKKAVENEIEVLRSIQLMGKVVKDLNLNTKYFLKSFPVNNELYNASPLVFIPVDIKVPHASFTFYIKDKKTLILETEKTNRDTWESQAEISFEKLRKSQSGSWLITPGSNIQRFIGSTITVYYTIPEISAGAYLKNLDVSQASKLSSIVELSMDDNVPERGKALLNSLIKNYDQDSKDEKNKIATGALEFIDNRLSSLSGELATAERNVEGFRSSNRLTNISAESTLFLDQVQSNDNKLNEVNVQLKVLDEVEEYINSNTSGNAPATVGISDPTLIDLIRSLNAVQFQKEHLLATNSEANPIFEPLNRQIRSTKLSIRENISNIRSSLNAIRSQLTRYNNSFESSIQKLPSQERHLVDVQRKQSIKENLYVYLMQKREEVALSFASTLPENRVIDRAYYTDPYWPIKSLIYFFAVGCSLLIPAGFLVGKSILFRRITSKAEIEEAIEVPVISELNHQQGKPAIVLNPRKNWALAEQFRSLRVNLKYLHTSQQGRVTLLTSSVGNEGKSFVSSNLGVALAASGKRTIILELDLRKPKVSKTFNLPSNKPGISDYLLGLENLENIIQSTSISSSLDVIGAGQSIQNPSELLEISALDDLIADLKLVYDDIILDSPPVHLVADAIVLSRVADVSLYLIRQGVTAKAELSFIRQLFQENKFPKMHIVFNDIQRMKYGYGYNYDQRYYQNRNLKLN
jgi:tyrosine-protein kinase Etk/Wzc